jgi:8-oxo-dGTP pyrophosphatase MutT (NUDIX family)
MSPPTHATVNPAHSSRCEFPPISVRESRNPRASPSGHLEQGESILDAAVRETLEETGLTLDPATLRLDLSIHHRNPETGRARIGFAFTPRTWDGEPVNAEPDKHSELVWASPAHMPPDTVGYAAAIVTAVEHGIRFTLNGW